jgi:hypothetical protein
VDWHLSTFAQIVHIARKLMSHLLNREAPPEESSSLTVLRENHIMILNSSSTADTSCLFTELSHVKADTTLSLSLVINNISFIHHDHSTEHLLHGGIIDTSFVAFVNDVSILVHDTETLNLVEGAAEV